MATYEVINLDKNGKVIPDMSKVIIPDEMQLKIFHILERDSYQTSDKAVGQRKPSV